MMKQKSERPVCAKKRGEMKEKFMDHKLHVTAFSLNEN